MSEVLKTLFSNDFQANLFPNNEFYKSSKVDAGVAVDCKNVEVPQHGSKPGGGKNPTSFPLSVNQREDGKETYAVHLYYTNPEHIEDENEAILSYSKRMEHLQEHVSQINTDYANDLAYAWAQTDGNRILRTSGSSTTALAAGATGNRKAIQRDDIVDIYTLMGEDDIPVSDGRAIMLVPPLLYGQLLKINDFIDYNKIGNTDALRRGVLGRLLDFQVMMRSSATIYDNTGTPVPKAPGAASAADDNLAIQFWHPAYVRRAEGQVKVYAEYDKPEYLGSVFNAKVRGGGMISRKDKKGVYSLVQAHV